jgi:hypothetical protein
MSYKITDTIIVDQNKNIGSIGIASFAGPVIIGGGTSTGTVSQALQVTGSATPGAYISGNVGIGSTNPTSKLWVSGDIYNTGIHTAQVLNASKDPGTGIGTDFTNSLFGNGWRVSAPGSTTYYKLATLPPGASGTTFDHLTINGVLGAWTNGNQTPFEITFANRGTFNYKYVSYGSVRSDVRIIGISTNSSIEIWAQHQSSQFTKLVYNITNSIEAIVVSNPTSTTTAPTGTTVFDSSTTTPRFIVNESDNLGIGTASPLQKLHVLGNLLVAAGSSTGQHITQKAYELNSGTISWEGSAGQLFSITNNLTSGSIFSVNDVSGIPSIDVNADGTVSLGAYGGNIGIGTTSATSKLSVVGDGRFTGVVTATTFSGTLIGYASSAGIATYATNAGTSTSVIGGIGSITQLQVTGISTFSNGPVLIGGGTSTGTAGQVLQIAGINSSVYIGGNLGIGTTNPGSKLTVNGAIQIQQDSGSNNRFILRGQPGSLYRWNVDNYGSTNDFRIFREDDTTTLNGATLVSISTIGTLTATKFSGDGSLLTNLPAASSQWVTTSVGVHTLSNVGIGTTNPTSKLHVVGDVLVSGVSTLGITTTTNLTSQQLNVSGLSTFSGITTHTVSLFGTQASFTGVVTASSFSGSGASLTSLNASNLSSGTVPSARITASSGDFTVGQNLFVTGTLSVGGTSVILNAAQLQIKDRDIVLGITTDANNNDVSTDLTATHGGISIASTVGSPILNFPVEAGINSLPSTYKQFMWIRQNGYSGMGTDAWVSNYAVSIGNTSTVQNLSRLTVGAGFTVFDTYLDATDIRARNISISGVSTFSNQIISTQANSTTTGGGQIYLNGATGNRIDFNTNGFGVPAFTTRSPGTKIVLYPAVSASAVDTAFGLENTALWTSVPDSTAQFKWYAATTNIATLFGTGELVLGTTTKTGTASQPLQVTGGAYVSGNLGIGSTNPLAPLHVNSSSLHGISGDALLRLVGVGGATYIQSGITATSGSSAPLIFTNIFNANEWARFTSSGNLLVGSATSTGTASQLLQVTGGAYVSGNLGIGSTNPTTALDVNGILSFSRNNTVRIGNSLTGTNSGIRNIIIGPTAGSSTNGDDNIFVGQGAGYWNTSGSRNVYIGPLTGSSGSTTTSEKVIIGPGYPSGTGSASGSFFDSPSPTKNTQLAIGIVNAASQSRYWLVGDENFNIGIGTTNPTSKLYVDGGAYVSGNLGVGATAPAFKADIAGDARVTSTNKMRFGGTAGTTNFYIQYNSTANSLDFVAG